MSFLAQAGSKARMREKKTYIAIDGPPVIDSSEGVAPGYLARPAHLNFIPAKLRHGDNKMPTCHIFQRN